MSSTYVIGLTGNIATGKSTVARMLGALGATLIDADDLAHTLMRPGTAAHAQVAELFGRWVIAPDGEIDRLRLGRIVFADPLALVELEAIIHPLVIGRVEEQLIAATAPVVCIEAIKLLEAGMARLCQAIWVVTCHRELQVERLVTRRHLSPEAAALRIDAQPPQEHKLAQADRVISNDGALAETWRQVIHAWNGVPGVAPVPADAALAPGLDR